MARIMVVQGSGRKDGFTATLAAEVVKCLDGEEGVEVEYFNLHDYAFGPCMSCFSCIRTVGGGCVLDDDWGRKGEGVLYQAFKRANALLVIDPVHGWGMSAMGRLFFERIYPTFWEGTPYGLPFASISCASNQGFQHRAVEDYCKLAAGHGFRYVGGLPVHVALFEEGRKKARKLALKLADAAIKDETKGRRKPGDRELFLMYTDTPWDIVEGYLANLTCGTFSYGKSLPVKALDDKTFTDPKAKKLLKKACSHLKDALKYHKSGDRKATARELADAAVLWTNATYLQFLEKDVVKAEIPAAYRPLTQ